MTSLFNKTQDGIAGNSGYTPLHYACREGHIDCVRLLLDRGAIVDSRTTAGNATPLHRAAFTGRDEIVRLLCASPVPHCGVCTLNALSLCNWRPDETCARTVRLSRGADPLLQDSDGQTAMHKACLQACAASSLIAADHRLLCSLSH